MKRTLSAVCAALFVVASTSTNAQLSGTYSVPATYSTVGAAIAALNTSGVSGAVTINVAAGHTETVTAGGYTLTATGTSVNPITFVKSGAGANPLLTAYTGTATPASATQDGVWRLIGSDYITIDGIDIVDPNTSNPATMEFGYCLFKADASNGCQYNTIKNCVITLNRVNNASGSGPSIEGSKGINVINATTEANTTAVTVSATAGSNSFNRFYSNTIQNCNMGIVLYGYAAASPFTLADSGNDIGGTSISTGNTIVNFGGGGTTTSEGISTQYQYDLNISYNLLNSNNGAGVDHAGILKGIIMSTASGANATVSNNTITIKAGGTSSSVGAIQSSAGSTAANNTISITNNLIINCTYSTATSGAFNGILNSGTPEYLEINGNLVNNNILPGTGVFTGINAGGSSAVTITMNSNTVTSNTKSGASGTMYCMRAGTSSITVIGNIISNNVFSGNSGSSSSSLYGYYNTGSPTYEVYQDNLIENLTVSGSSSSTGHAIYGMYSNTSSSSLKTISENTIRGLSLGNTSGGTIYGLYHALANTSNIFKNKLSDFTKGGASGACYGFYINSGTNVRLYNNLIGDLKAPAANATLAIAGIYINGGTSTEIYFNTISLNASSTGAQFGSTAIFASAGPNLTLRNNILVNNSTPSGTAHVSAFSRSAATFSTFSTSSDNNVFYAGTPGASNLIFYNGTAYQTLAAYQAAVYPAEVSSKTENTPFLSLVGTSVNFLHIDPNTPSLTESGAVNIAGITDDIDGQIRQGNTGYIGNGTAPDIGADEFSQTLPACTGASAATIAAVTLSSCATKSVSFYSTGYSTGSGTTYQWQVSSTPGGPYSNVSDPNSVHHAYSSTVHPAGVHYFVMVTTCSAGPVSAVSNELSYTVLPTPTVAITAPTVVCAGTSISLSGTTNIGTTYDWVGPNGFTANVQSTVIPSAGVSASGNYTLTSTLDACVSDPAVASITVSEVTLSISNSSAPELCFGNSATLTANTSGNTYTWSTASNSGSIVVSPSLTTSYDVTVSNVYNCTAAATATVSVVNVTIAAIGATACPNETATLSVSAYTPSMINWFTSPTSTLSLGSGSTFTVSAPTNTTVYAEAHSIASGSLFTTLAGGNSSSGNMFDIIPSENLVISGVEMHFTATGTVAVEVWYRSGTFVGNESSSSGWTQVHSATVTSLGSGVLTPIPGTFAVNVTTGQTYALYVTKASGTPNVSYSNGTTLGAFFAGNSDLQVFEGKGGGYFSVTNSPRDFNGVIHYLKAGCSSGRSAVTLSVSPSPSLVITPASATVCALGVASFTASGASTYTWNGTTPGATFTDTPSASTVYSVTGTSSAGCESSETVAVTTNSVPVIIISPAASTVCAQSVAGFTASGAASYSWSTGDQTPTATLTAATSTVISVTGTNALGCVSSETAALTVNPLPVITIAPSSASVCEGGTATLTASGAVAYLWNTGDQTATTTLTIPGNTLASVSGTDAAGCAGTASVNITALPLPTLSVAPPSATVCAGSTATLTASGALNYSWSTGAQAPSATLTATGNTVLTVSGTNSAGCSNTASVSVTANPLPTISISQPAASVCVNSPVSFTASGATNYQWTSGPANAVLTVTPSGSAVYTVTGSFTTGCASTATAGIFTFPLPVIGATPSDATICAGENILLIASGGTSYVWMPGNATTTGVAVAPAASVVYTVTGTDSNNCSNTASVSVIVDPCTGIAAEAASPLISLYPNPSSGVVTAGMPFSGEKRLLVLNAAGALVLETSTSEEKLTIDLSNMAKGIYFIRVSGEQSRNFRIVIQ